MDFREKIETRSFQYRKRRCRDLHINLKGIEPKSKNGARSPDRDSFQAAVIKEMRSLGRHPFTGPIALQLNFCTSEKAPPPLQTIAKNILDLLGRRRQNVEGPRAHVLYKDDSKIQALSVTCCHGEEEPSIRIDARPFSVWLADLELSMETHREYGTHHLLSSMEEGDPIGHYKDLLLNAEENKKILGDFFEFELASARKDAQEALFFNGGLTIPILGLLYGLPSGDPGQTWSAAWAKLIENSPVRLHMGDLPIKPGQSDIFKENIRDTVEDFKKKWKFLIDPLDIPIAIEVIVRPNPNTPSSVLHDLDNIVRDYLLPAIVPAFGTVTDWRWTIGYQALLNNESITLSDDAIRRLPPKQTRAGVTRYDIWRLPPHVTDPGFVSVSLVGDLCIRDSIFRQIDDSNCEWADDYDSY
ncbi:hypothetical protein AD940_02225 [Gluconobacter thailandicus]|nr:hypothetical protein AD940_02225 [Gluconobacter thailandicus]